VDVKAGRRSDLAKYTDIARPCLDIHEHGGRLDAVGRQRAISGIGLAINSVRRPIGSSVFGLTLESRAPLISKTFVFETAPLMPLKAAMLPILVIADPARIKIIVKNKRRNVF
jgi:hypothetical protein